MAKQKCLLIRKKNIYFFKIMLKSNRFFASQYVRVVLKAAEGESIHSVKFGNKSRQQSKTFTTFWQTRNNQIRLGCNEIKFFHTGQEKKSKIRNVDAVEERDEQKSLMYNPEFERFEEKNKKTFLETVRIYKQNVKNRSGHVEFMKAALRNMKAFGVHRDLECYKKILDVLPKGIYVCTNKFLADGMYFPRQQFAVLDLLDQLDQNAVLPDVELGVIIKNIFGSLSHPYKKYCSMLYWSLKFKNMSEYHLPRPLPSDQLELAKLAIGRITSVDLQTEVSIFQSDTVKDSIDKTWIVSGQSPKQRHLLKNHPKSEPVIVEGGDLVWLREVSITYFVLKSDGMPIPFICPEKLDDLSLIKSRYFNPNYINKEKKPTVHEQDDGKIYAVCATGTSSKDSLLSWVRLLQENGNPVLADVPVLFRFRQPEKLPIPLNEVLVQKDFESN